MQFIEGKNRTQSILFPQSLDQIISTDNEVRIIDLFVESIVPKISLIFCLLPKLSTNVQHRNVAMRTKADWRFSNGQFIYDFT